MKRLLSIAIMMFFILVLSSCKDVKNVEITFISDTKTQTILKKTNKKITKSDVPFEQECNILNLFLDEEKTISCLDLTIKEDTTVYVDINWGKNYILSNEQMNELDKIIRDNKLNYNYIYKFNYYGNYHDYIIFNVDDCLDQSTMAVMRSLVYKGIVFDVCYLFLYYKDGKYGEILTDKILNKLSYKESMQIVSAYCKCIGVYYDNK